MRDDYPLNPIYEGMTLSSIADEIESEYPNQSEVLRYYNNWHQEVLDMNKRLNEEAKIREALITGMEKVLYAIKGSK